MDHIWGFSELACFLRKILHRNELFKNETDKPRPVLLSTSDEHQTHLEKK